MKDSRTLEYSFIVGFSGFVILPVLYIFRRFDHNTLTSWQWVFSKSNYTHLLLSGIFSVLIAYVLSRLPLFYRYKKTFLFISSFLACMAFWPIPEVIIDAGRYFTEAKYLELRGAGFFFREWGGLIPVWTDLPAIPFLYGLVFKYIGEERILIQILNTLMFSSTVIASCLVGRELWDEDTGFYGGMFLASITYLYTQVPLMLVDVGSMFFLFFTLYLIIRCVKGQGLLRKRKADDRWFGNRVVMVLAWIFIALTLLAKFSLWPMFFMLIVSLCIVFRDIPMKRWLVIIGIPCMFVVTVLLFRSDVILHQFRLLMSYQWEGLKHWQEGLVSSFFFQSHPFVIILAVMGGIMAVRRRDSRVLILLWPLLFILLFNARRMRYIIPLLPFISLLAGYGLRSILDRHSRPFLTTLTMVTALMICALFYRPFLMKISLVNIKEAGSVIDTLPYEKVLVYPITQDQSMGDTRAVVPILDLFTDKMIICMDSTSERDNIQTYRSPLQFTWELGCPELYNITPDTDTIALPRIYISSTQLDIIPQSGYISREFTSSTGRFRYKTFVTLLIPHGWP